MMPASLKLGLIAFAAVSSVLDAPCDAQTLRPFVVSEPIHSADCIPFYIAARKGFFRDLGIDIKILTVDGGGIDSVLSGDSQAFIGGPEHIAYVKAKGGRDVRAVAGIANRANQYYVAAKSLDMPASASLRDLLKGKRFATGTHGTTPYAVARYLLSREGLDPVRDVILLEIGAAPGRLAAIKAGQVEIAALNEPIITQGVRQGIVNVPFLSLPRELGPFPYSTLNVPADLIDKEPRLVKGLVDGLKQGLEVAFTDRAELYRIAHLEFPTVALDDLSAVLDREVNDRIWERTGAMPRGAWDTLHRVIRDAGLLSRNTPYESVFDPRFLN
jgi:NitT/TauT family transport system substrate-binding protein